MIEPLIHSGSFGSSIGAQNSSDLCSQIRKIVTICLAVLLFIGIASGASYAIAAYVVCATLTACVNTSVIAGSLAALIAIAYLSHNNSRRRRDSEESEDTIDIYERDPQDFEDRDPPNGSAIPTSDRVSLSQINQPPVNDSHEKTTEQSMVSISIVETTHERHIEESHNPPPILDKGGSRSPPDPTDHTKLLEVNTKESYENASYMIGTPKSSEDLLESSGTLHIKRRNASYPVFHLRRIKQTSYRTMSTVETPILVEDSDKETEPDSAPLQDSSPKKTVFWGGTCITCIPDANTEFNELQNT